MQYSKNRRSNKRGVFVDKQYLIALTCLRSCLVSLPHSLDDKNFVRSFSRLYSTLYVSPNNALLLLLLESSWACLGLRRRRFLPRILPGNSE